MRSWYFPNEIKANEEELVDKLYEEVSEFVIAYKAYNEERNDNYKLNFISEGLDVIHVIENIFHNCDISYKDLDKGVEYVTIKNELRGYYGKDDRPTTRKNQVQ